MVASGALPRVLYLHSQPSELDTVIASLAQSGYEIVPVDDPANALAYLRREHFGVVLAELDLRVDPGRLVLAELRALWPETVGLIVTNYESLEAAADILGDGACDFLVRPVPLAVLKASIARAMERGALARALRQGLQDVDDANARLQALSDDLQRRVDEATGELREKVAALDAANNELRFAQEQREALVSMIAHDLGGPLTAMSGYLQLLERPNVPAEQRQRAQQVLRSEVGRLARLVGDLADAPDTAAGRFSVELRECDLAALVREQVELAKAEAPDREILSEVPDMRLALTCDRARIAQVLRNLMSNAIRYAPSGPIHIRLWNDENAALVSVADEGAGIPPGDVDAIFEPRVRLVGEATAASATGKGLGLHIARGIIEGHDGQIWVESEPGRGTTFVFRLPHRPRFQSEDTHRRADWIAS